MENLFNQPGLYAFAAPQELPPLLKIPVRIIPKGLVWNVGQMGQADKKTLAKIAEMNRLKKELGL